MQIDDLFWSNFGFYLNYSVNVLLKKETVMILDLLLGNFQSGVTVNFTVQQFGKAFDFAEVKGNFAFKRNIVFMCGKSEASRAKTSQSYSLEIVPSLTMAGAMRSKMPL